MIIKKLILCAVISLWILCANSEELLKSSTSWDGGKIEYPKGKPEITSVKLKISENKIVPFHCHPVPTLGYILKGKLEVETKDGKKIVLNEGESVTEVMRTVHRGKALDEPVEIIVFYAGATSIPNTVFPENDPEFNYCNK
ncbi:MAG: cupin domain-containing protein [Gammaproteobacteria bacterium]|nr:cupin domain-containing protein [Gammaproteobacteria bacterium]